MITNLSVTSINRTKQNPAISYPSYNNMSFKGKRNIVKSITKSVRKGKGKKKDGHVNTIDALVFGIGVPALVILGSLAWNTWTYNEGKQDILKRIAQQDSTVTSEQINDFSNNAKYMDKHNNILRGNVYLNGVLDSSIASKKGIKLASPYKRYIAPLLTEENAKNVVRRAR